MRHKYIWKANFLIDLNDYEEPLRHSVQVSLLFLSVDGNILLNVLFENGTEPVSFDYAIGASVNVSVAQAWRGARTRGEHERVPHAWTCMWCSVVIINP